MSNPGSRGARRPFLEPPTPVPFWRSPEFTRFAALALVALAGAAALLYTQRDALPPEPAAQPAASVSQMPPLPATATLTPEELEAREAFLATAFEGALRGQENGARRSDTTGSRKLLEVIAKFDGEEFSRRTQRTLDYMAARADPAAWQGQYVRLSGLLTAVWPEKLARPVEGRTDSWRAQIGSGDEFGEPTLLEFIDRPFPGAALDDMRMRPVEIEGIFFRTTTFESEFKNKHGQTVEAVWEMPWIFVRNIRLLDTGEDAPARTFLNDHPMFVLGILAFVIFGGRLVIWWIQARRRSQRRTSAQHTSPAQTDIRAMFERKLRERGIPPAPPSPPKP